MPHPNHNPPPNLELSMSHIINVTLSIPIELSNNHAELLVTGKMPESVTEELLQTALRELIDDQNATLYMTGAEYEEDDDPS